MPRYWQDIRPGEHFTTAPITLQREDILSFAAEFDPQPYHLDAEAAEASIFGGLCASGWQVAALMMRLLTDALREREVAVLGVGSVPAMRWKLPVFAGDTLSARVEVSGREPESRQAGCGGIVLEVEVSNQDATPVIALSTVIQVAHGELAHAS